MDNESFIILGGIFNLLFAVFHLFFWKIFRWNEELARLGFINRGIMQVLNLCLTFAFIIFGYISIFHINEMMTTNLGTVLLILISLFWFLRAIEQIIFFKLKSGISIIFLVLFTSGGLIYLYSWIHTG